MLVPFSSILPIAPRSVQVHSILLWSRKFMLPSPRMDDPLLLLRVPRDVLHAMGFLVDAHLVPTGILHLRGLRPSFYRSGLSIPASIADSAVNPLVRLLKRANLAPAASGTGVLTVSAQHQPLSPSIVNLSSGRRVSTLDHRRWHTELLDAMEDCGERLTSPRNA